MQLDPNHHPWLASKATERIFDALPPGSTRFVGGCVRNAVIGAPVSDLDLATTETPDKVAKALKSAGIAVHETGLAHGTLTAVCDHTVYEITTLRQDVSTDGRRATVAFTTDWQLDAQRRDFTINALYATKDGEILAPTGQGLDDIKARRIRFVGRAENRIKEDYLRILRYFRFYAWYGAGKPMDKAALSACRTLKSGLKTLSSERIWAETKKLLAAPRPERTINTMLLGGILELLLPEASNAEGLQLLCSLEQEQGLDIDPYLRLMAMAARDEMGIARMCRRLKMSNAEKARLMNWARDRSVLHPDLEDRLLYVEIYKAGRQTAMDRALIRAAGSNGDERQGWVRIYTLARDWQWPEFPLTGQDLIKAGIESGPQLGKTLEALRALWMRSGFKTDRQALLAALSLLGRGGA
ncbi:MAG TPA: CCA tRNA nucleotidyltransferase [Hellea balneolensis]|uniref:CCA tRNA nucleotidyltransferase n=1 Tax=Hellea balneolensis TaxID=287478 RepID=A0A7C5R1C9_9PROT|nr:CCA tRNA nucleotidyltransferase [Hellea balneolensis]